MTSASIRIISLTAAVLLSIAACCRAADPTPLQSASPMIGTSEHGHVYPGATVPFGMVQLSPDTRLETWDGSSGYHYSDRSILGFSHTHLSGTGCRRSGRHPHYSRQRQGSPGQGNCQASHAVFARRRNGPPRLL